MSKFLLIFFLARFLEPGDLGIYGLFSATVGYGIYALGFEFYTFSMRELINSKWDGRAKIVKTQFYLYSIGYLISASVSIFIFYYKNLSWGILGWFLMILILEHAAQELNRILVSLSEPLFAGFVLFVRTGLWGLVVIALQWTIPALRNLDFVFSMWLVSCLLACLLAISRVKKKCDSFSGSSVDLRWIMRGLKIAVPMLLASLAVRGIVTFDRYFVEGLAGLEVVGAYVLFGGMATAVISFLDAGLVDFSYPKLVAASRSLDKSIFRREMKSFAIGVIGLGFILIFMCGFVGYFFVGYLGKVIYTSNVNFLYWFLVATAFNALSLIPHIGLYSLGKDRSIVASQVFGLLVFLSVSVFLGKSFGVISILWAICFSWLSIFVWKALAYRRALTEFNAIGG